MSRARKIRLSLGALVWLMAIGLLFSSYWTVHASLSRSSAHLQIRCSSPGLTVGDLVYIQASSGLVRAGEVAVVEGSLAELALSPEVMARLTRSTTATVWMTPLSARASVEAILPSDIQERIAEQVLADWADRDDSLGAIWQPIARELAVSYWHLIQEDLGASLLRHRDEFGEILRNDLAVVAEQWPAIQARLSPILHEHVTPVLSRLMSDALKDAPKVNIMWLLARGKSQDAFQATLDWLSDYLADIPEEDSQELSDALRQAWEVAREDAELMRLLSRAGETFAEDPRLREVVLRVFRESVTLNPRTADFLREEVLQSARIHDQLHTLIQAFAPTARRVLTMCLFDEEGATRPEVVHLVRSVALGRKMAWVTLFTPSSPHAPLTSSTILDARIGGAR